MTPTNLQTLHHTIPPPLAAIIFMLHQSREISAKLRYNPDRGQ